ncbi:TM2 domain-containing protein [Acetanaerobacterium elongatum]|uniref:TM2 domain-containing protein n=1 Tax=Acetanaerobacterium elongatum TaxID=258515 RepID=A0A1G9W6C5_9FIRM|nr:TM2 domain-containing protein [Acetanaerobacterium elongatum]SDM80049.1 TM2 domain-containing protein [Acetanaerobacterium elongatum]
MSNHLCPQCGAPNAFDAKECAYCGEPLPVEAVPAAPVYQRPVNQQPPVYSNPPVYPQQNVINNNIISPAYNGIDPAWPIKSKVAAGLLAIFLGGLGIHKFYLGKIGMGILYLCFCWTYVPAIIGLIEGIVYLASNDHNFQVKNHVRLK